MRFWYEILHEKDCLKEEDLPDEYRDAIHKISKSGIGVCSRCRNSSGCLSCDAFKCIRYCMRKQHKKTAKPMPSINDWAMML